MTLRPPITIKPPKFMHDIILTNLYFDELPITYKNQGRINIIRKILNYKACNVDVHFLIDYIWSSPNKRDYKLTMNIEDYINKIAYKFGIGE